jgi:asparagine N-glycosylation enzyme membrane subunit Stt3
LNLVTFLSLSHPGSAAFTAVRLFSPFALFTLHSDAGVTAWRGSPWFFLGWQLALCAIAVLAALLRGAEGRARSRIIANLSIAVAAAVIMLVLAATGGFPHALTA